MDGKSEGTSPPNSQPGGNGMANGANCAVEPDPRTTPALVKSTGSKDASRHDSVIETDEFERDWRFWIVIVSLCIVGTLGSLEGAVVATALPSIIADLSGENTYIWVVNAYFLTR